MCELYGFSGKREKQLNRDLREFFGHSADHPDGWGLVLPEGPCPYMKKAPEPAFKSREVRDFLSGPRSARVCLAHIRQATIGYDEYCNTHPFLGTDISGRTWILIHNGTIFEGNLLSPYMYRQKGWTDSERILLCLIARMSAAARKAERQLEDGERFQVLETLVRELAPANKLNLLIYDGTLLYAHYNARGTLHVREEEDAVTFSTAPLAEGSWQEAPFCRLTAWKEGRLLYEGKEHEHEYIPDEASIRALFMAYAGL